MLWRERMMDNGEREKVLDFLRKKKTAGADTVSVYGASTQLGIPVSTIDKIFDALVKEGVLYDFDNILIEGMKGDIKNGN